MKNAMQLKAFVKNLAKEKKISAQIVLQNYMLERLLERISLSKYRNNFILKGGFLISAIVGLDTRATMDLDTTMAKFSHDKHFADFAEGKYDIGAESCFIHSATCLQSPWHNSSRTRSRLEEIRISMEGEMVLCRSRRRS